MEVNEIIEMGFKYLIVFFDDYFSFGRSFYLSLFFSILLALYFALKRDKRKLIDALGLNDQRPLNLKYRGNYIEVSGVLPKYLSSVYWRNNFEILGNILNAKFIDVKIKPHKYRPSILLFYDQLPSLVSFNEIPSLIPMQVWIGKNQYGDDVKLDLQSQSAIYVDGKPGSGKTVAIISLIKSYQMSFQEKIRVVAVTTKPADYYFLKKIPELDLVLIDPFEGSFVDRIQDIKESMSGISEAEKEFKKIVLENSISNPEILKLEVLRQKGFVVNSDRVIYVFDEAKDYLSKSRADSKEITQAKLSLIDFVYTHIRRTSRFLSMPIIVASQTQSESDLDIPLKAFHIRIASNTNEAMSRIICGDNRLTDMSFHKGKFLIRTNKEEHIVRTPLLKLR